MNEKLELKLNELNDEKAKKMIGPQDKNLVLILTELNGEISYRNGVFFVAGEDRNKIGKVLTKMSEIIQENQELSDRDIIYFSRQIKKNNEEILDSGFRSKVLGKTNAGKTIYPKTMGQFEFVKLMEKKDIVFAVGPAGTGKTYLAVVQAAAMLKNGDIKKIVLTRPAVEAGESLGFLPGDLKEKVDPYLTPLYDALYILFGAVQTEKLIEKGVVEIAPLAYMRGRTLEDVFVILDEAQNTTSAQMKMFLTRLGFNSKMVITGDITQVDLKKGDLSGLVDATQTLKEVREIGIVHLTSDDVVRHPLVQKIIDSYDGKK